MAPDVRKAAYKGHRRHVSQQVAGDGPGSATEFGYLDFEVQHDLRKNRDDHRLVVRSNEHAHAYGHDCEIRVDSSWRPVRRGVQEQVSFNSERRCLAVG